jgi:flagellar basal body-associated protein FliL
MKKLKRFIIPIGIGLALITVTAIVTFILVPKGGNQSTTITRTITVVANPPFEVGPLYTLQTRVVNLGDQGSSRYLKITTVLAFSPELDKEDSIKEKISSREIVLQDILTTVLSDTTTEQLTDASGKEALKKTLIEKFSQVLTDLHLIDIYFPDFVMQ